MSPESMNNYTRKQTMKGEQERKHKSKWKLTSGNGRNARLAIAYIT
jgi:hypothetical protein